MKKRSLALFITALIVTAGYLHAQVESTIILNRGKLWQTLNYGKTGPSFSNWSDRGIGLDWPGFDPTLIAEDLGGAPSYMVTGGMYVGAKWSKDSILTVEDWSLYAGSIAEGAAAKYRVTKHHYYYNNGDNYWLKTDPNAGEQVVETVWEYNTNYDDEFQIKRMLPVRVSRVSHQWSGQKDHENYIIHIYTIKNISPEIRSKVSPERFVADTLYDFYALINYGLHANSRSWRVLYPSLSEGARNTWFRYDGQRQMVYGYAADYEETAVENDGLLGFANTMGPLVNGEPTGEYLSPGHVGVRLLYSSEDKTGSETRINQQGWSAASNSIDLSGPFTNLGSMEAQYAALQDIRLTSQFVDSPNDDMMKKNRMWTLMSVGPYDILPGDSIVIAVAEIVDGADYDVAIDPHNNPANSVQGTGRVRVIQNSEKAKETYENNLNHPDPPAAPAFEIDYNRGSDEIANIITFGDEAEDIPDPDDGTYDLAGYIIYRSFYLPIGPWEPIDTIMAGDPAYYDGENYRYQDNTVDIGQAYYYAITSFDTGKDSWIGVDTLTEISPLESSIFANRSRLPFVATSPPATGLDEVLVVPNPFVIGEGFSQPGGKDRIQFVNLPNPCVIRIYTVRGDLVKTIRVAEGTGAIASWDQLTDYGQFVESGMYIYHIEAAGAVKTGKLAIVR